MPQKLLSDHEWLDELTAVTEKGRKLGKEVCLHTHFNHPNEITGITKLNHIHLEAGAWTSSGNAGLCYFDNVRIGTTWYEVMVPPWKSRMGLASHRPIWCRATSWYSPTRSRLV